MLLDKPFGEIKMECKRCGCTLYSDDSIKAGYCGTCASQDEDARNAWKEKGLAKFCSECGHMLHSADSITVGICTICRIKT